MGLRIEHEEGGEGLGGERGGEGTAFDVHVCDACESCREVRNRGEKRRDGEIKRVDLDLVEGGERRGRENVKKKRRRC